MGSPTPLAATAEPLTSPTEARVSTEARLTDADAALQFGDYPAALQAYAAGKSSGSAALRAAGLFGQGLVNFKLGDYFQAKPFLLELISTYPDSLPAARASYLLARIAVSEKNYSDAVNYLTAYQQARPGVLDAFILEQIGDLRAQTGEHDLALKAYSSAYLASDPDDNAALAIKVGSEYMELGQNEQASAIYRDVYARTADIYLKSQLDLLLGRASIAQGAVEEGFAYTSMRSTTIPGRMTPIPPSWRSWMRNKVSMNCGGLINYFGVNMTWRMRLRSLHGSDGLEKDKAYYQALVARAKGLELYAFHSEERFALNRLAARQIKPPSPLERLVSDYPKSNYLSHAIEDIVYTQYQYMNRVDLAPQTALDYVSQQPLSVYAPSLLFTAGRYLEIQGKLEEAAQVWDRIAVNYPSSDQSFQGAFFAGILHYRRGDITSSAASFNRAILLALEPLESAGAYLWLGKLSQAAGDLDKARAYWNSAAQVDPAGYYGLRAVELAENKPPFASPEALDLRIDLVNARQVAAAWMRTSFNLPRR